MTNYNCEYREGKELDIGDNWHKTIEANNPREAYEKFIKDVSVFQKPVIVDGGSFLKGPELFDDHVDKELQKKIIEQEKLQLEEKKAEEDKKKLEQKPVPILMPCSTCKKSLSTEAKTCPHCGQPNPTKEVLAKTEAEAEGKQEKSNKWFSFFFAMIVWFGLYKLKILGKFLLLPYHEDPFLEKDIWIFIVIYLSFKGCKLILSHDK